MSRRRRVARRNDQTPRDIVSAQEFLEVEASHDGLANSWTVGQEEVEGRSRDEFAINSADLTWKRLHVACRYCEHRVELARAADALGLGCELEIGHIGVESPSRTLLNRQRAFVLAVHDSLDKLTILCPIRNRGGIAQVNLDGENSGDDIRDQARKALADQNRLQLRFTPSDATEIIQTNSRSGPVVVALWKHLTSAKY